MGERVDEVRVRATGPRAGCAILESWNLPTNLGSRDDPLSLALSPSEGERVAVRPGEGVHGVQNAGYPPGEYSLQMARTDVHDYDDG